MRMVFCYDRETPSGVILCIIAVVGVRGSRTGVFGSGRGEFRDTAGE